MRRLFPLLLLLCFLLADCGSAALDGWGVTAWFFGPGGAAETEIACIAVN